MRYKVVAYMNGVPNPRKNQNKLEILKRFINGVTAAGDNGHLHFGNGTIPADVAVIQGWVHAGSDRTPHLMLRKKAVDYQKQSGKTSLIVDSNLFNYRVGKDHNLQYLRYSFDGVFPTTGNYFETDVDPNRWVQIQKDLGLELKDWRTKGEHILITTQRNGGWSMQGNNVVNWLDTTIEKIKQYTDRPIIVRGHPGDKRAKDYLANRGYTLSTSPNIVDDFKNAWATVTFNSSPGVASAIEGVPVFVTDPNPKISQAYSVANTNLSTIDAPELFDRQDWVERLSMSHWKFSETQNGSAWKHMRKFL